MHYSWRVHKYKVRHGTRSARWALGIKLLVTNKCVIEMQLTKNRCQTVFRAVYIVFIFDKPHIFMWSINMFDFFILMQLEKLWADVCTMIQSRYSGPYDSDLLNHLSPLLQATFLHSRRQIKNQTVLLWNATFSRSAPLTYPDELQ